MNGDEVPDEYKPERAEYLRLRDDSAALVSRLMNENRFSEARRLDAFYEIYCDDYWERLRASRSTRCALDVMRTYLDLVEMKFPR